MINREKSILSTTRLNRLRAQGYSSESDQQLSEMAFGIRFAYQMCVAVLIVAMVTQSVVFFWVMFSIALFGLILPNHPFDYVYNSVLSRPMNRPKLPPRSKQLKFACSIATVWLAAVIFLLSAGFTVAALILAGMLVVIAALPSATDFCVPSMIYNSLFQRKAKEG